MGDVTRQPVTGTFTATGQSLSFTSMGGFNLSISGTYVGTISLQRSFDEGTTWKTVTTFVADSENEKRVDDPEVNVYYRLNCTAYTSGTATYRLSGTNR